MQIPTVEIVGAPNQEAWGRMQVSEVERKQHHDCSLDLLVFANRKLAFNHLRKTIFCLKRDE
jgi:hypothetical protein